MRIVSFFFMLTLNASVCYGQYAFEDDSAARKAFFNTWTGNEFGYPNFDSINFEFRLWSYGDVTMVLTLSQSLDASWEYSRGYFDDDLRWQSVDLEWTPNIDSLWRLLSKMGVETLPDQKDLVYEYSHDDRLIKLGPENEMTEQLIHSTLDGNGYFFQLISVEKYRDYYYYEPLTLNHHFQSSGDWCSPETSRCAQIITTLSDQFKLIDLFRSHVKDRRR